MEDEPGNGGGGAPVACSCLAPRLGGGGDGCLRDEGFGRLGRRSGSMAAADAGDGLPATPDERVER